MPGKKAVHFGSGNIGRGFVACFLHESGYDVIFADVVDKLVDSLNASPSYKVIEVGTEGTDVKTITNYRAINSRTHEAELIEEISTADVVTCSVGPNILKFIAPVIAKGIDKRPESLKPLAVIACENAIGATDTLAGFIKQNSSIADHSKLAAYANSAIDRIVPAQDADAGLDVKLEQFYEWVVDKTPFESSEIPSIDGIKWVDNLLPYIERKLFTVNTGHATAAYHGYNRKKQTVDDALRDKEIKAEVSAALAETSKLIVEKHGISAEEQEQYKQKIISRINASIAGETRDALVNRIQFGGDEVVKAKDGAGSATLSMAMAGARFAESLLRAAQGEKGVIEPTFVDSPLFKDQGIDFFASKVELGPNGAEKIHEVGPVNEYEQKLIDACLVDLKKNIQKGVDFVKANP